MSYDLGVFTIFRLVFHGVYCIVMCRSLKTCLPLSALKSKKFG